MLCIHQVPGNVYQDVLNANLAHPSLVGLSLMFGYIFILCIRALFFRLNCTDTLRSPLVAQHAKHSNKHKHISTYIHQECCFIICVCACGRRWWYLNVKYSYCVNDILVTLLRHCRTDVRLSWSAVISSSGYFFLIHKVQLVVLFLLSVIHLPQM